MKTYEKFITPDGFCLPLDMLSNDELCKEYTRLTGQLDPPPFAPDANESSIWRYNLEQKVKRARQWNDIDKER